MKRSHACLVATLTMFVPWAGGQSQEPAELIEKPIANAPKVWREVLRRGSAKKWELTFSVQALLVAGEEGGPESADANAFNEAEIINTRHTNRDRGGAENQRRLLVVLPWVDRSAVSAGMEPGDTTIKLNGTAVEFERVWMSDGEGHAPLPGCLVTVPPGMELNFTRQRPGPRSSEPREPGMPADEGHVMYGLLVDATVTYTAWTWETTLHEPSVKDMIWPDEWSPAFACELDRGVLLERAPDPTSRRLRDLDLDALSKLAMRMASATTLDEIRARPPGTVIRTVANAVMKSVRPQNGLLVPPPQTWKLEQEGGGKIKAMPLLILKRQGAFQGFDTADALTILKRGYGNEAERATALAAVYRRLGIPARVVAAVDAGKMIAPEDLVELLDEDPERPRDKRAPAPADVRLPQYRVWVEVAVRHRDRGEAWIPIDPGSGGQSWKMGEVRNGKTLVPIATSWWPHQTVTIGTYVPDPGPSTRGGGMAYRTVYLVQGVGEDGGKVRFTITRLMRQQYEKPAYASVLVRTGALGAGLWGYATEGVASACVMQSIAAQVKGGSVRSGEKPPDW